MNKEVVDVWNAFLNTLKNRGLAELNWEIGADVRAQLIGYFKEKIDAGASLPNLLDYIYRFPKKMQWELREYAQNRLKTNPNNGAAAKFLAIDMAETYSSAPNEMWPLLETAMRFLPNDIDICFLAFEKSGFDFLKEKAVISLERLFERLNGMAHKLAIDWV